MNTARERQLTPSDLQKISDQWQSIHHTELQSMAATPWRYAGQCRHCHGDLTPVQNGQGRCENREIQT